MNKVQQRASLCPRSVQKIARGEIKKKRARAKLDRKPTTKVLTSHWSDGLDPRVVAEVKALQIPQVWRRIEVISPTEVVIHNPGWKKDK